MATQKLIARAPIELWGLAIRPAAVFTTTPEMTTRLIAENAVEVYGDQAVVNVAHYDGAGDGIAYTEKLKRDAYRAQFVDSEGQA